MTFKKQLPVIQGWLKPMTKTWRRILGPSFFHLSPLTGRLHLWDLRPAPNPELVRHLRSPCPNTGLVPAWQQRNLHTTLLPGIGEYRSLLWDRILNVFLWWSLSQWTPCLWLSFLWHLIYPPASTTICLSFLGCVYWNSQTKMDSNNSVQYGTSQSSCLSYFPILCSAMRPSFPLLL